MLLDQIETSLFQLRNKICADQLYDHTHVQIVKRVGFFFLSFIVCV